MQAQTNLVWGFLCQAVALSHCPFSCSAVATTLSFDRPAPIDNQDQAASVGRRTTQDSPRRACREVATIGATTLYSVELCVGLRTMMQSCASAARLLGGRAHSLPRHCGHGWLRVTAHLGLSWHCITPINAKPVFDGSFG